MKKLANILTLVLALGFAQTLSAQTFSIGAGSASHIYVFGDHSVAVEPGLSLDFEAGFPITDLFTIGTGASLTGVYGYHFGGNEAKNIGEIFLDIPVRAKFYIPLGSKVSLVPFAGAILSTNLVSIDAHANGTTSNYDIYHDLKRFDVMLGGGVGVDMFRHVRVELGFDYGLMDRLGDKIDSVHRGQLKLTAQYIF